MCWRAGIRRRVMPPPGFFLHDGTGRQAPWRLYLEGSVGRPSQAGAWACKGAGAGLRGPGLNPDGSGQRPLRSPRGTPKVHAPTPEVGRSTSRGANAEPQGRRPDLPGSRFRAGRSKAGPVEVLAGRAIPMCRRNASNRSIASVRSCAALSPAAQAHRPNAPSWTGAQGPKSPGGTQDQEKFLGGNYPPRRLLGEAPCWGLTTQQNTGGCPMTNTRRALLSGALVLLSEAAAAHRRG